MKITKINEHNKQIYFQCLERPVKEMEQAVAAKEKWYNEMKDKGLRVKMAEDDNGEIGGMIQYFPIEHSWVKGKDLYFISCIWVHPDKNGVSYQKKGLGKALLAAAEEDVRELGKKGIVAWGTSLPVWMKAAWYKKQGFKTVDSTALFGGDLLLWKPFTEDAEPPKWVKQKKKPEKGSDKVKVTCLSNGWCSAMNMACHTTKEVAAEFGDDVEIEEVNTLDKENFEAWGKTDVIYIDGKQVSMGPPPTKEKLRKIISKKVNQKK